MTLLTRKRLCFGLCIVCIVFLAIRYLLYHGTILAPASSQDYRHTPGAPVLVSVYYEALCPDSKHFVMKQLLPAYKKAAPLMEVQLVAYGKAQTNTNPDGSYRFDCQHGELECQANMYHACAMEVLSVESELTRLEVVACMIRDNRLPKEALHRCAKQHNVENIDLIQKCFDSTHGAELLKLNGDATNALRPSVSFIPTITLDGSQGRQAAILKNLLAEVCKIAGDTEQAEEICQKSLA